MHKGWQYSLYAIPRMWCDVPGYIGYHLQQAIQQELKARGVDKECAAIVTQVVVDENDPGFAKPTKPVGSSILRKKQIRLLLKRALHL